MYHKILENTFYLFKSAYKISTFREKHFCHQILNCIYFALQFLSYAFDKSQFCIKSFNL